MSFAQGTLHYNLPITIGSDKRTWFDTNEAFIAIDAAIWEASQSASAATTAVEALTTQVGTLSESVQTVANAYTALSGSVNTLSEVVQGHTLNIQQLQTATANKADSVAIADAYNPNLTYSVGDVVMYDGQRYKCITAVTTGEPFDQDKWQGEDVQTVLDDINSDLVNKIARTSVSVECSAGSANNWYGNAPVPSGVNPTKIIGLIVLGGGGDVIETCKIAYISDVAYINVHSSAISAPTRDIIISYFN